MRFCGEFCGDKEVFTGGVFSNGNILLKGTIGGGMFWTGEIFCGEYAFGGGILC